VSASALMVLGTASHVGKSLLTAGLGRIFSDDGIRVAPFKAQNMSLNSAATPDGREIGRAQALQAEACRVIPCAEMNPVLIKPSSDTGAQVILLGKVWGQVTASDYHQRRVEELFPVVLESYRALAARHQLILLEGAGSPAEINLRAHDIVNMRMANAADASCLLVGDIDRGGVFASLLGTMELLELEDRARIRGFVINKFRGDVELLRPGIETIEQRLNIPCAGVVPFLKGVGLEDEDSVSLEDRQRGWQDRSSRPDRPLRIGVIAVPHMANFTDFDALAAEPSVALGFLDHPAEAALADAIILPGSKQTLDDLQWILDRGLAPFIAAYEGLLMGICGGFQMLGLTIADPKGVESGGLPRTMEGLGRLSVRTSMRGEKTVRRVTGRTRLWGGCAFTGYEIHMGETISEADGDAASGDAIVSCGQVYGTYIHGLFDDDAFRHSFLEFARCSCGLAPAQTRVFVAAEREARIDRWAAHLRQSLDLNLIRGWANV
jgi:adenosylcobyric acid synthase